jgi:hypothetical protein
VLITPFYVNYNLTYEVFSQLHVCKKLHYKWKTTTYTIMKISSFSYLPWYFKFTKYEWNPRWDVFFIGSLDHHEFAQRGQMVNKQLYQSVLVCLRDAVRRKRPELWEKPDLDAAPRQCTGSTVTPHPQISGKTQHINCARSTLFSSLSPGRLFSVSQT